MAHEILPGLDEVEVKLHQLEVQPGKQAQPLNGPHFIRRSRVIGFSFILQPKLEEPVEFYWIGYNVVGEIAEPTVFEFDEWWKFRHQTSASTWTRLIDSTYFYQFHASYLALWAKIARAPQILHLLDHASTTGTGAPNRLFVHDAHVAPAMIVQVIFVISASFLYRLPNRIQDGLIQRPSLA
jgi:hypothetical protein